MSDGYAKLFSSILDSTVWDLPQHVRIVWVTMLAMKGHDGVVEASIPGLARRARVTVPECEEALCALSSPDPYSRTKDHDGRRIVEVDGGWEVLNHVKYKHKSSEADRKEKGAARAKAYRERCVTRHAPSREITLVTTSEEDQIRSEKEKRERESAERGAADAAVPDGTTALAKAKKERRVDKAVVALRGALKRFIEVPPELTPSNLKRAANRLQSIVDCGHAKDLDDAAACLVHAAVASGKPWPWCLMDAQPKRAMPDYEAIAAKQRAEREKVRV